MGLGGKSNFGGKWKKPLAKLFFKKIFQVYVPSSKGQGVVRHVCRRRR
jgi:hypothetical protein